MAETSTLAGYGKPPAKNQFKKGKSGNPKGRPPKKRRVAIDALSIIEEPLTVKLNGKTSQMSPFEISTRKLSQKAMEGDLRAIIKFIKLCGEYEAIKPVAQKVGGVITAPPDVDFSEWFESVRAFFK